MEGTAIQKDRKLHEEVEEWLKEHRHLTATLSYSSKPLTALFGLVTRIMPFSLFKTYCLLRRLRY